MTKSHPQRERLCDDLVRHPVREVVLFGIAAHVYERQNCDRRPIGQLERDRKFGERWWRCTNRALFFAHPPDEPQPLAWQGLDEVLPVTAVANCRAGSIDPRCQRRFRNDAPLPD